MTVSSPVRSMSEDRGLDPVLDKLARTNTFESDWPTLQHHMVLALSSAVDSFLSAPSSSSASLTPRRQASSTLPESATETPSKASSTGMAIDAGGERDNSTESTPPPLTSPSAASASSISPQTPTLFSRFAPAGTAPSSAQAERVEPPSTPGGLVLPPFPPLDMARNRERRRSSGASSGAGPSGAGGRGSGSPAGSGPSIASVRVNGHPPVPMRGPNLHPLDDEWDEDIVIGGKMLPGQMPEDEAKKEVARLAQMLEEFAEPPFTIQRLAELLSAPFSQHLTPGKYLRAIEKLLLVTTPWEAPSYVPVPANTFAVPQPVDTSSALASPASSPGASAAAFTDIESTMPPRSVTPMFSPVPFGRRLPDDNPFSSPEIGPEEPSTSRVGAASRTADTDANGKAGLLSPLTLGAAAHASGEGVDADGDVRMGDGIRSPAPEPEDGSIPAAGAGVSEGRGEVSGSHAQAGQEGDRSQAYTDSPRPAGRDASQNIASGSSASSSALQASTSDSATTVDAGANGSTSTDPAHQPYLGRVDELDTGPLTPAEQATQGASGSGSGSDNGSESPEVDRRAGNAAAGAGPGEGTGEGGTMMPHGMSDKPVALSSTTTVEASASGKEREVASLPRRASVANLAAAAREDEKGIKDGDEEQARDVKSPATTVDVDQQKEAPTSHEKAAAQQGIQGEDVEMQDDSAKAAEDDNGKAGESAA